MKILFCDWNGTLFMDVQLWYGAMRAAFRAFGKKPPTKSSFFQELTTENLRSVYEKRGITASREEINVYFRAAYEERMYHARLSPGAKKTLVRFKQKDVHLVLLTAQHEYLVAPLLEKFSLYPVFAECFFHRSDKDVVIAQVIQKLGACPRDCFMVGDVPPDMCHAKAAGITAIGFLNKANSEASLRACGADCCIRRFNELLDLL